MQLELFRIKPQTVLDAPQLRKIDQYMSFDVDGVSYVANRLQEELSASIPFQTSLLTIIVVPKGQDIDRIWLQTQLENYPTRDDVFTDEFLAGIIFIASNERLIQLTDEVEELLQTRGTQWVVILAQPITSPALPVGPFLLADAGLWQVFRLYDDTNSAFLNALVPRSGCGLVDESFRSLRITSDKPQTLSIAVPSRIGCMYQRPLEGVRIAVKDLFHLRGLTSSLCNRAYYRVNEPSLSTADCINTLVAQGAQVLGVTKLSSMISREEPTEAVDYAAPFNPRGDGYQSPAGSSSGSAVAVASYDWLDLAIGTDTSGSGRRPALVNGVFQLRPSHAMVSLEGMVPTYLPFDTPCVFGRDLARLKVFAQSWYAPIPKRPNDRVPCIIVPSDFVVENREQTEIIDAFIGDLEQSLSVKATRVSISELWRRTAPSEATDQDLNVYLKDVIIQTYYHGFYKSSSGFRQRYLRMFGKQPYVNNFVRWRWNLGREVDDAQHQEGMRRTAAYRTWLLEEIFRPEEQMPIFVLPIANVQPTYRDVPPDPPLPQSGFDPLYISPILGAPDIMLPIGEVRYHSRITESEEYLPVGVNLVGAPGDDTALMETALDCLVQANRPTKVETGTRIFPSSAAPGAFVEDATNFVASR